MKRITAVLLCLCVTLSMVGCTEIFPKTTTEDTSEAAAAADPTMHETSVPSQTEPTETLCETQPVTQPKLPLTAITLPVVTETCFHEDGTLLFYYSYPDITLIHQDSEVAKTVLLDLRNRVDATSQDAAQLKSAAITDYAASIYWNSYLMEIRCTPARLDQSILSLVFEEMTFSGGMRPNAVLEGCTYDLVTGSRLTIGDILSVDYSSDQLCALLLDALQAQADEGGFYPEYKQTVSALFAGNTLPDSWYFSETGLVFFFMPYEIAPYSSGTVTAEIPYESLNGILKDKYYPAETIRSSASFLAGYFDETDLSQFSRFAEVIVDADASAVLLYPQGTVSQIRIEQGYRNYDSFTVSATVFASEQLTTGDAVMLQYRNGGELSEIRIRYVANGEARSCYLSYSGTDGAVVLIPEN